MKVDILYEGRVIGHSDLEPVDPPMAVAGGRFVPAPEYAPRIHAVVIDGDDNVPGAHAALSARSDEYGTLVCVGICIEDYEETLEEIIVTVVGIAYPEYETAFASHPYFKAYWGDEA